MDRIITFDCYGNDITCMKVFDALENPCSDCDNEGCPNRDWDKEEVWDVIHELSDIRAQYSVFDKKGREKYHACSLAIKALREVIGE